MTEKIYSGTIEELASNDQFMINIMVKDRQRMDLKGMCRDELLEYISLNSEIAREALANVSDASTAMIVMSFNKED